VPGIRTEGALQMLAEIGPTAAAFPSPEQLASWVGVCPGQQESAGQSYSQRSAKGNWQMRRLLSQAAHAASHAKGSFFESLYRRLVVKIGPPKAIWAVAHRLCRLIWKILHEGVQYHEQGAPTSSSKSIRRRQLKLTAEFRKLGFQVQFTPIDPSHP